MCCEKNSLHNGVDKCIYNIGTWFRSGQWFIMFVSCLMMMMTEGLLLINAIRMPDVDLLNSCLYGHIFLDICLTMAFTRLYIHGSNKCLLSREPLRVIDDDVMLLQCLFIMGFRMWGIDASEALDWETSVRRAMIMFCLRDCFATDHVEAQHVTCMHGKCPKSTCTSILITCMLRR